MSLRLSKNNTPTYNYVSEGGSLTNPIERSVIIDKLGGTKASPSVQLYLIASKAGNNQIGNYSDISVEALAPANGVTWQLSLNNSTWVTVLNPATMDCSVADAIISVYARIVVDNSASTPAATGKYSTSIKLQFTENPAA
jgi:hypothetical protein